MWPKCVQSTEFFDTADTLATPLRQGGCRKILGKLAANDAAYK